AAIPAHASDLAVLVVLPVVVDAAEVELVIVVDPVFEAGVQAVPVADVLRELDFRVGQGERDLVCGLVLDVTTTLLVVVPLGRRAGEVCTDGQAQLTGRPAD